MLSYSGNRYDAFTYEFNRNVTRALTNPNLVFSKLSYHTQKLVGLADAHLKLVFLSKKSEHYKIGIYANFTISTGYKPKKQSGTGVRRMLN